MSEQVIDVQCITLPDHSVVISGELFDHLVKEHDLLEASEKKLSVALQRIDELSMAERLNVETVAALKKERDELWRMIANYS